MTELHTALAVAGAMVIALGLLWRPLERSPFSAPLIALLLGVALGPQALGVLDPSAWGHRETLLEGAARLTIAIGLMSIALYLPPDWLSQRWRSLAVLLAVVMPLMALAAGLLAYWLLALPLLVALLIGAVLSPTDPIVAATIVTGDYAEKSLPQRLRHLLLGESGANDGLAYPLVFLPLLLLVRPPGEALGHWLAVSLLYAVGVALALGTLIGHFAGRVLLWAEKHHAIEVHSLFAYTLALTLLVLGALELVHADGILGVFVAGIAFSRAVGGKERVEEERVQEAINRFFTLPIFVLLGLVLPWAQWQALGWPALAFAVAVLLLRRLPAVLLVARFTPDLVHRRDRLFAGWFGPLGIAALFYAVLAVERTGQEIVWTVASLAIAASVLAHGITAAPFTRRYARRASTSSY
ncbi:MAG TPA: cation:proton antiporter [Burkholderiales bacterium]|nr:cation:proton antiporter [Burkholderiales bacterium]